MERNAVSPNAVEVVNAAAERWVTPETVRAQAAIDKRVRRDAVLRRMLALADLGAVFVAALTLAFRGGDVDQALYCVLLAPIWIVLAKLGGLYHRDQRSLRHLTVDEAPALFLLSACATFTTILLFEVLPVPPLTVTEAVRIAFVAAGAMLILRSLARMIWRRVTPAERTVILGEGASAAAIRRKLELFSDIHVTLARRSEALDIEGISADDGSLDEVDRLIVADTIEEDALRRLLAVCRENRIKLSVVPPARGLFGTAVQLNHVADLPLVEYNTWDAPHSTIVLKRGIDVVASAISLVLLAPLFVIIAVAIKIDSKGGVFFRQTRCGLKGETFRMIKFRTMVADAEARLTELIVFDELPTPMFKLPRDPRVTRVGRVLRRTSLDELPQLVNVLLGEMSLVGPRPEQVELVSRYAPEHFFRFDVKPGLTGPMQVYGRGELSFEERLAVERDYVENLSLSRDIRLLALTLPAVLGGRGAF